MNRLAHGAYLDDDAVITLGEERGIVIDIRHINVHSCGVHSGWTAIVRSLNCERVT